MGWTKRQYIEQAFEELGLAAYAYDLTAEQLLSARRRLDAMLAGWNANGVRIGWNAASDTDATDFDTDGGAPDVAHEAIYLNLAIRLAPSFGKQPSPETVRAAGDSLGNLQSYALPPVPERQMPRYMPRGAGAKPHRTGWGSPFVTPPREPLQTGPDHELAFE